MWTVQTGAVSDSSSALCNEKHLKLNLSLYLYKAWVGLSICSLKFRILGYIYICINLTGTNLVYKWNEVPKGKNFVSGTINNRYLYSRHLCILLTRLILIVGLIVGLLIAGLTLLVRLTSDSRIDSDHEITLTMLLLLHDHNRKSKLFPLLARWRSPCVWYRFSV